MIGLSAEVLWFDDGLRVYRAAAHYDTWHVAA